MGPPRDGVFQDTSHIFIRGGHFDLALTAGIPVALEIAIYNGPDGWVLGLARPDGENLVGNDSTITIRAAPEPSGMALLAVALAALGLGTSRKRGASL